MIWPKDIKLGWAMPLSWPYINAMTHTSLLAADRPDFVLLEAGRGGDVAEKRDTQVKMGMKEGCTHFILLDADMIYPPTFLKDLFKTLDIHQAHMVGGLCFRGYEPYDPLIWDLDTENLLKPFDDYKFGDIVKAGATGAACLLIKREVFEKLERPWFQIHQEEKTVDGKNIVIRRGEDIYFTRKATTAGFKLLINTDYDIGHLREFAVDRHLWLTFGILNKVGNWDGLFKLLRKLDDKGWKERELGVVNNQKGGK